jgi:hypothetical protein
MGVMGLKPGKKAANLPHRINPVAIVCRWEFWLVTGKLSPRKSSGGSGIGSSIFVAENQLITNKLNLEGLEQKNRLARIVIDSRIVKDKIYWYINFSLAVETSENLSENIPLLDVADKKLQAGLSPIFILGD